MTLLEMTVKECLNNIVKQYASQTALIENQSKKTLSWQQLQQEVESVARGFLAIGLKKGDRLGIWSANSKEWIICFLAAAQIGVPVVCINFHFKKRELLDLCRLTGIKALCFSDGFKSNDFIEVINCLSEKASENNDILPRLFISMGNKHAEKSVSLSQLKEVSQKISDKEYQHAVSQVSVKDLLTIQMTSGSTAMPKGVMLSQYNVINNAMLSAQRLGVTHNDVICLAVPLFHCFGLSSCLFFALTTGCQLVLLDNYCAEDVLKVVQDYRCTVMHGVPTIFSRLMKHEQFSHYDLSSLDKGIIAGASFPSALVDDIENTLGMKGITVSYGQTEASPCCTQTLPNDALSIKRSSIGKPLPFVEMKIISPKTGKPVPVGVLGEICTRGFHVMMGYDNAPDKTKEALDEEGWLHTGDIGYVDKQGNYHYAYRMKEIVVRGGENISLCEIEEAIAEYPGVDATKAFGIPSTDLGEEVIATICVQKDYTLNESELRTFLQERLARYKIPKELHFFTQFPHTPCGKIDVQALKLQLGYGVSIKDEETKVAG
ncbi:MULTISPECIES: AMP-binding protein [Proteus]|jgi:fatty-acyl-CoA synthase|uniref:Long-chain-fatty-acid--CoA ligase n=2 Tax=Proteus TaxID=583 RepID=A0A379FB21_PROVU|nr:MULTISPECIES: AMP-binding protein [Proteus]NBN59191.1 AMP-binding protein [Proteus sp. G2639]RNT24044.1 acyl-CoA synthase [Proteus mirabilis]AYY82018.1 acyl-CoA synthase [Proteus vulgaris]KGA57280.1 AMP-binding enzyme family protein [Proteus vulgaris]MBG5970318.1 AMP-binding protein [Proteus vulgaris]